MRNILDRTPKSQRGEVHPHVKAILNAPDQHTARILLRQAVDQFEKKAPRAIETLERGFEDATAIMQLPERYRKDYVQQTVLNALTRKSVAVNESFGSSLTENPSYASWVHT